MKKIKCKVVKKGEKEVKNKCYIYLQGGSVIEVNLEKQMISFDNVWLTVYEKEERGEKVFLAQSPRSISLPAGMIDRFEIQ